MTNRLIRMTIWNSPEGAQRPRGGWGSAGRVAVAVLILASATGCRPRNEADGAASGRATEPVSLSSIHSKRDIDRVLKLGMTTNEVLARVGDSAEISAFPDGTLEWTYWLDPFPGEGKMRGLYVLAVHLSV